uniref:Uncharacterized protein n=1 Tax=Anopheles funestus TaxID=62324 RepID=A0A182S0Z0_ANOFN
MAMLKKLFFFALVVFLIAASLSVADAEPQQFYTTYPPGILRRLRHAMNYMGAIRTRS